MSIRRRVLILGGTGDARALAAALAVSAEVDVVSSLAGRTARLTLPPGEVRVGGFGGAEGLARYLERERFAAVVDATHPFATRISANVHVACTRLGVPLVTLERHAWTPIAGDRWHRVSSLVEAAELAPRLGERIFLTIGRQGLAPFANVSDRWFLIRAIDPPKAPLPVRHEVLLERGPFTFDGEVALVRDRELDVVVSKNSGGEVAAAKLAAARALGIPVVMIERPSPPPLPYVTDVDGALAWLFPTA